MSMVAVENVARISLSAMHAPILSPSKDSGPVMKMLDARWHAVYNSCENIDAVLYNVVVSL